VRGREREERSPSEQETDGTFHSRFSRSITLHHPTYISWQGERTKIYFAIQGRSTPQERSNMKKREKGKKDERKRPGIALVIQL